MSTNMPLVVYPTNSVRAALIKMLRDAFSGTTDVYTGYQSLQDTYGYTTDNSTTRIFIVQSPIDDTMAGVFDERPSIVVHTRLSQETNGLGGYANKGRISLIQATIMPLSVQAGEAEKLGYIVRRVIAAQLQRLTNNTGLTWHAPTFATGSIERAGSANLARVYYTLRIMQMVTTVVDNVSAANTNTSVNVTQIGNNPQ